MFSLHVRDSLSVCEAVICSIDMARKGKPSLTHLTSIELHIAFD